MSLQTSDHVYVLVSKPHTDWKTWSKNFVAGSCALSTAFALTHPLDTIKTRMQSSNLSTVGLLRPKNFRMLFKGFTSSVVGAAPQGGIRLSTYEGTKSWMIHNLGVESAFVCSSISAVCGDLVSSVVKVPREITTQRIQAGLHSSFPEALSSILKEHGIRGLYAGGLSTSLRDIPFMVILFGCYEEMRKRGIPAEGELTSLQSTVFGGLSGGLAGLLTTPVDVVKTKIMTSSRGDTISSVSVEIYRGSGVRGFFVGSVPRTLWWFSVCSIFFPTYETLKSIL